MTINYSDPRVRKTRHAMRAALFALLEKQGYDSITIQNIADEAEMARITFYRHYRDKEELLDDCLNYLFEEILQQTEFEDAEGVVSPTIPTQVLFEHLSENEKLYKILLSSRGGEAALSRLRNYLIKKIVTTFDYVALKNRPGIPDEIIANHLVSAQVGLGIWWLENDKPYSIEYMIEMAHWLSFAGAFRALGLTEFNLPAPRHVLHK